MEMGEQKQAGDMGLLCVPIPLPVPLFRGPGVQSIIRNPRESALTRQVGTGIIDRMKSNSRWRRFFRRALFAAICLALLLVLTQEWPDRAATDYRYDAIIHNRRFDFVGWELRALTSKALYGLAPPHTSLSPEDQKRITLRFIDQLHQVRSLEDQIAATYADPAIDSPRMAVAELQLQMTLARQELARVQPLAEGILEEQIASVLAKEGITMAGRIFPPVSLRFTPLPTMLVVSPRDRIEAIHFFALEPGLGTIDRVAIEEAIDQELDVSSLVTNIGGLAVYPAMMPESSSLPWVTSTGAHEWTHHYLTLHPLGILYGSDAQLRTMNETVANIVGKEIANQVVQRYYPELVPTPLSSDASDSEPDPNAFEFRAEMRITRLHVDGLLAQGKIEAAEVYMEARRRIFWENGYHHLRKLNQAYFAFHGAYADEPGGAGADPVGPAVVELRAQCASLGEFLQTMAPLTSFGELEAILED